jgi:hypothetical protein
MTKIRYREEVMGIHSRFLVHWTGKDIKREPESERPQLYVERLADYYQNGLYAKRTREDAIRRWLVKDLVRLCFTEIRLSQVQTHSGRYGKLGIGFSRDFIMSKGGRPVIYIPYEAAPGSCILEDSIKTVYERSGDHEEVHRAARWIMAYVKRMSDGKGQDFYEEMEWRVVHDERQKHFTEGESTGVHRLKFGASDVRVVVFPDENTKRMSLEDEVIRKCLSEHMPLIATVDDCPNF